MDRQGAGCGRSLILLAVILFTAVAGAGVAFAHAFLDHAEPRVGSTVSSSPPAVTLTFTEPVEPDFCRLVVRHAHGQPIHVGALEHPQPEQLRVVLPELAPGDYSVHWTVTSVDTHQTEGSFEFTVRAP